MVSVSKFARPKDFYINESLTPLRPTIQHGSRRAKRRFPGKVLAYGSQDGRVYVLTPPLTLKLEKSRPLLIRWISLMNFALKRWGVNLQTLS